MITFPGRFPPYSRLLNHQIWSKTISRSIQISRMDEIKDVDIDPEGKFKYILITLKTDDGQTKSLVRGYKSCGYHADILEKVENEELYPIKKRGLKIKWDCPGGGRILHKPGEKSILVYGYSQGFGRGDHSLACDILKNKFPEYSKIEWSNEGY